MNLYRYIRVPLLAFCSVSLLSMVTVEGAQRFAQAAQRAAQAAYTRLNPKFIPKTGYFANLFKGKGSSYTPSMKSSGSGIFGEIPSFRKPLFSQSTPKKGEESPFKGFSTRFFNKKAKKPQGLFEQESESLFKRFLRQPASRGLNIPKMPINAETAAAGAGGITASAAAGALPKKFSGSQSSNVDTSEDTDHAVKDPKKEGDSSKKDVPNTSGQDDSGVQEKDQPKADDMNPHDDPEQGFEGDGNGGGIGGARFFDQSDTDEADDAADNQPDPEKESAEDVTGDKESFSQESPDDTISDDDTSADIDDKKSTSDEENKDEETEKDSDIPDKKDDKKRPVVSVPEKVDFDNPPQDGPETYLENPNKKFNILDHAPKNSSSMPFVPSVARDRGVSKAEPKHSASSAVPASTGQSLSGEYTHTPRELGLGVMVDDSSGRKQGVVLSTPHPQRQTYEASEVVKNECDTGLVFSSNSHYPFLVSARRVVSRKPSYDASFTITAPEIAVVSYPESPVNAISDKSLSVNTSSHKIPQQASAWLTYLLGSLTMMLGAFDLSRYLKMIASLTKYLAFLKFW